MRGALVLSLTLALFGCDDGGPLTIDQVDAIIDDAAQCDFGDTCVVVDTYCCPAAVNADQVARVKNALGRLEPEGTECLADCIGKDELVAECVAGRCQAMPR